jgi:hypothetical protein
MGIVCAEEEQANRNAEEELFARGVLISVVNLLPHIQIVISTRVEFKRHPPYVMEHEIGAEHVGNIRKGPRCFLRDSGDNVEEDFERDDEDNMDSPCT